MVKYSQAVFILARQYRVPAKVIQQMVTDQTVGLDKLANGSQEPDGLITIREAAERYQLNPRRIHGWIDQGKITPAEGRRPGIGRGGEVLLIPEQEVALLAANPPKPTGRPPKIHA